MNNADVIIGSGFSGAVAAARLVDAGFKVDVNELHSFGACLKNSPRLS